MRIFLSTLGVFFLMSFLFIMPAVLGPSTTPQPSASPVLSAAPTPSPAAAQEIRAVWVSFLEWQHTDFSSESAFRADATAIMQNIASLGANTVFAHVRPFGDALYPSRYFPFSHLCTGTQGQDPGFDPLAVLVETAHAKGLTLEAWINPYRLQANGTPAELCAQSPALLHPNWVKHTATGLYLDPASIEVQQYLADSIRELCTNYAIDGIHFDDYFYPTTAPDFDADSYAASGSTISLADWRRQNVNDLMRACYAAAHAFNVRFGVSPQGTLSGCRDGQYSDAALWLAKPGYCDYLIPQLYWGLNYRKNGSDALSLGHLAAEWLSLPRTESVQLAFGLGAYRIGDGDEGDTSGPGTEWCTRPCPRHPSHHAAPPRCQRRCPLPLCFSFCQHPLPHPGGTGDCGAAGGLGIDCRHPHSLIVLNVECANYKIQEENCQSNCKKYLSRWPILKEGHIRYQVIMFERVN